MLQKFRNYGWTLLLILTILFAQGGFYGYMYPTQLNSEKSLTTKKKNVDVSIEEDGLEEESMEEEELKNPCQVSLDYLPAVELHSTFYTNYLLPKINISTVLIQVLSHKLQILTPPSLFVLHHSWKTAIV